MPSDDLRRDTIINELAAAIAEQALSDPVAHLRGLGPRDVIVDAAYKVLRQWIALNPGAERHGPIMVGDVVTLKSGGPLMTVTQRLAGGGPDGMHRVAWTDQADGRQELDVYPAALRKREAE